MSNASAIKAFTLDLTAKSLMTKAVSRQKVFDIIMNMFSKIVIQTPRDKGVAQGNWNLSLGSPDERFSKSRTSGENRIEEGERTLRSLSNESTVYITNSTVYIRRLEEGHSKQAPNGWVKRAVEQARKGLK